MEPKNTETKKQATLANPFERARESFSGRLLTDPQFDECMAINKIIGREIHRSGRFKDKLGDYSYAFSRSEKFDVMKAETILRDLFKETTGRSMNQLRETLMKNEEAITDDHRQKAYESACNIGDQMEQGDKLAFHRALAEQAQGLAEELHVTDVSVKRMMAETFEEAENTKLHDWGKELDEQHYRPQIEAAKQERKAIQEKSKGKTRTRSRSRSFSRSGPQ